jgi:hypothetical protein
MKKGFVIVGLFLALLWPMGAQADTGSCTNPMSHWCYVPGTQAPIFGPPDVNGCIQGDTWSAEPCPEPTPAPTPVPTAVPTPTPPPDEGGLWGLIQEWANKFTIWKGDAGSVAKMIAVLMSFLGIVQAIKKLLENAAKWEWILKLVPQLAIVFKFFAHGIGPIVLNAAVTGGTMLIAALQDGALTAGEVIAVLGGVVGVDLIYRFIRKYLFPKTA